MMNLSRSWAASIRTRLVVGVAVLYALLIGVFVLDLVQRQQKFLHQEQIEDVLGLCKGLAQAGNSSVLSGDVVGLQEVLAAVTQTQGLRYGFMIDDEGKVLAHTDRALVGKYVADPVSLGLLTLSPEARVLVDSPELIDVAAPVLEHGRRVGWVRIGVGQDSTRHAIAEVIHNGLIYTAIAILLGAAFAAWVGRRLTRSLYRLLQVAEATRDGERSRRADVTGHDEIGALSVAFNDMLDRLVESESGLRRLNEELEERVAARTADLTVANRKTRESELRYRSLLENLPHRVFSKNLNSVFLAVNPAFARPFGATPEQMVGRTDRDFVDASRAEELQALDRKVMATGQRLEFEEELAVEGEPRNFHTMLAPVFDDQRRVAGLLGISWDISERKRAENALTEASRHAEAANQAKSDFLANMSHEIRTPMNAVIGLAHLLGQTRLDARQRDYLDKIASAANALLALLNGILDLSKVEAGKLELETQPFRLDQILRDLATILSATAQHKDIEVLFNVDPDVPTELVGDALRLNQVLINLAGNAIKFTDHGEVLVSVTVAESLAEGIVLRFSIRDTGIGITPEQRERLFQAFNQGDSSTSRRFGGTGLGLAISGRLVQLMGGELEVDSQPGQGSDFHFTARFGRPAAASDGSPSPGRVPGNLRVLVVDDNATARMVMERLVATFGWQAEAVPSGEEALCRMDAAAKPYDLVLMDWKMPGMDGLETSRRIREAARGGPPPVIIVVSAYGREIILHRAAGSEIDALLVKPVTASMLFDAVADIFGAAPALLSEASRPGPLLSPLAGLRLLVAEDNAINRQVASEMLAQAGALVTLAHNGAEALRLFREKERAFDAVLMDIQMPEMDGYAATAALRALPAGRDLPIIAMTANAMASDRERCLAAGMDDHVSKPLSPGALVGAILACTGREAGAAPAARLRAPVPGDLLVDGIDGPDILGRLGGDEAALRQLLGLFARQLPAALDACAAAVAAGCREELDAAAHALKGMAGNAGAVALAHAAAELEKAARERDGADWDAALADVRRCGARVEEGIAAAAIHWPVAKSTGAGFDPAALARLENLLADGNFAAVAAFDGLWAALAEALGSEAVAPLAAAVEAFDFAAARACLAEISRRLPA